MTEVRAESNATYRKPSGIPRLNKKLMMENAVNFSSELQDENLTNRNANIANQETYRQETCYCNNCYNRTKNLCRFTLNENLINSQKSTICEPEKANNSESDDERSSITPDTVTEHQNFETYSETYFPNRFEENQIPSRLYKKSVVPTTDFPYNCDRMTSNYNLPTGVNNTCDHTPQQFGILQNNSNAAVGSFAGTSMPNISNGSINLIENKILSNTRRYVDKYLGRSNPELTDSPNMVSEKISSYCRCMPKHAVKRMDVQNIEPKSNNADHEMAVMCTDQSNTITDDNEQNIFNFLCRRANRDPFVYESKDQIRNNVYLTCLLKNDSIWKDNIFGIHKDSSADKSVCGAPFRNNSKTDELLHKHKTINSDLLLNTLHEIFGSDSHIVEKIRKSKQPQYAGVSFDARFRNSRHEGRENPKRLEESKHCNHRDSDADELKTNQSKATDECEKLPDTRRNEDEFSSVTQSSCNDKSVAETFASALQYECCKKSSTKYCKQKTCISVKRCNCDTAGCAQLDEIHSSLTSIQSEIKMLIENMPSKQVVNGNFSGEINSIKKMYEECILYERKRSVQYKYIQKEIREIYKRLDDLGKNKRGRFFFKYFVVFPVLSVVALYSLACLTECKEN